MSDPLFPDFPYSVRDEPTADWKVEHVLQWCLLQSTDAMDTKVEELINTLSHQLSDGKEEIRKLDKELAVGEEKNDHVMVTTTSTSATTTTTNLLRVEILSGFYAGKDFDLRPTVDAPCLLGRSQGKQFKTRGISLPKDGEVSTTHGKFIVGSGNGDSQDGGTATTFYFVDTGSSNGTFFCNESRELEVDVPLALKNGFILQCGQTKLKIILPEQE